MNISEMSGSVYCQLERMPTPKELQDIIESLSAYWPHTAKVVKCSMFFAPGGAPRLDVEWRST